MNIEEVRDYCLLMGGVTEKIPFGKFCHRFDSTLVFYVRGHMFCLFDMDNFDSVTVRSTPEEIEELKSRCIAASSPLNPSLKFWITIDLNKDVSDRDIFSYITRAYEIIVNKYSPRKKK